VLIVLTVPSPHATRPQPPGCGNRVELQSPSTNAWKFTLGDPVGMPQSGKMHTARRKRRATSIAKFCCRLVPPPAVARRQALAAGVMAKTEKPPGLGGSLYYSDCDQRTCSRRDAGSAGGSLPSQKAGVPVTATAALLFNMTGPFLGTLRLVGWALLSRPCSSPQPADTIYEGRARDVSTAQ
jgi:hypothetical protein